MKKRYLRWLCLALCLAMLAGCGGQDTSSSASSENPSQSDTVYDDSLIEEVYSLEKTVTDSDGYTTSYSFHIPHILDDTSDALDLNTHIDILYTSAFPLSGEPTDEELMMFPYSEISWKSYWNGSLLSLVIQAGSPPALTDYDIFNYDFATGELVFNEDLLERLSLSPEDFVNAAERGCIRLFDETNQTLPAGAASDVSVLRSWTASGYNISPEMGMYLGEDGALNISATIGTPAGGGYFNALVPLDPAPVVSPTKTASCGFVEARLEDGAVSITFKKSEDSAFYLGEDIQYGEPYPLNGLYGSYTDMYMGIMGQDFFPYLFLVNDLGQVECCNIIACAQAGYFCSTGPLIGLDPVTELEAQVVSDPGSSYHTVFATTESGQVVDLSDYTVPLAETIPFYFQESTWPSLDERYFLSYNADGVLELYEYFEDGSSTGFSGTLTYLGVTGDGLIYGYDLWDIENPNWDQPAPCHGTLALQQHFLSFEPTLDVMCLSGTELFGLPLGQYTSFMRSYG